ncbi:sulfurtransferase [Vallitalea okinawensis]|uniref:sulfurtransferase n=1 Tax=Vallitalea okinawensis TaxID=2078660 RepID=UPI000CFB2FCF|nr:rhodanese-like domain-containing protein [Vallitalea okinawensis]
MKIKSRQLLLSLVLLVTMVFLYGCASSTTYKESNNVIEASALKDELSKSNVIVIDARSAEDYAVGHLDGAVHLNPSELTVSEPVKATIAPKEQVEAVLSSKGISNDSIIYVYDNSAGVYAGRVWWTLKAYGHNNIKLINGGQKAIESEMNKGNLAASAAETNLPESTYVAKDLDASYLATLDDVKAYSSNPQEGTVLLDVRSVAEYEEGTIPNAVLYPHTKNLYTDGTFKSDRTIYLDYNKLGIDKDDEIILFCKSSYRATQTALLLEEAGYTNVKVFDGAWIQWSGAGLPVQGTTQTTITSQDAS